MKTFQRMSAVVAAVLLMVAVSVNVTYADRAGGGEDPLPDDTTSLLQKAGDHYTLSVPRLLSDGILLNPNSGDSSVKLTKLVDSDQDQSQTPIVFGDVVAYPDYNSLVVAYEDGGFAILEAIMNAESPEAFRYRIDIGRDQTIAADGLGGYVVVNKDGGHVVSLGVPWAFDGKGEEVPTLFTLDDDGVITLEVAHRSMEYTYPIVADPCFRFWSGGCKAKVASAAVQGIILSRTVAIITTIATGGATAPAVLPSIGIGAAGGAIMCMIFCNPD